MFSFSAHAGYVNLQQCMGENGADVFSSRMNCQASTGSECVEFPGGWCQHYEAIGIPGQMSLKLNAAKKAAHEAKIEADKIAKEEAKNKIEAIRLKFKSIKKSDIKNESDLKDLVIELVELLK